jgi:penicillin-binding protein 2
MSEVTENTQRRIRFLVLFCLIALGIILIRLWLLQVVWGQEYKELAEGNRIRQVAIGPARGLILDRHGEPLVKNRLAVSLSIHPQAMEDKRLIRRLSKLLKMSEREIVEQAQSKKLNPIEPRVVKRDLSPKIVAYIKEHNDDFVGVELKVEPIREYPKGQLAAHVVGYLGELSEEEQGQPDFAAYDLGDLVGKSGVEKQYDSLLTGSKGRRFMEVNAAGEAVRVIDNKTPDPGNNVLLTIDAKIQASAEQALATVLETVQKNKFPRARSGAIVVMTPRGEILAMASHPTYDPSVFVGGISSNQWAGLMDKENDYPLNNRAIMSGYPPASTFKVVTAVAGFKTGVMTTGTTTGCKGFWMGLGSRWIKNCWGRTAHGTQNVSGALRVSCNTFFYEIGHRLGQLGGEQLQHWSRELGFGEPSGIDLPAEARGRVPTAAWKRDFNRNWPENQSWFPGDTVNLAIGQGDMLATPLQLAGLYAGIAADGAFYRPHVVKSVVGLNGREMYKTPREKVRMIDLEQHELAAIKQGLRRVVADGTASGAFSGFPVEVSGKTGTAEVFGKDGIALFAGYAPADKPEYVVAVVLEEAGNGGSAAAPAARMVLSDIFNVPQEIKLFTDRSR